MTELSSTARPGRFRRPRPSWRRWRPKRPSLSRPGPVRPVQPAAAGERALGGAWRGCVGCVCVCVRGRGRGKTCDQYPIGHMSCLLWSTCRAFVAPTCTHHPPAASRARDPPTRAASGVTRPKCVGLPNSAAGPSNYCFMNSTLQCLRHTPSLAAAVCSAVPAAGYLAPENCLQVIVLSPILSTSR